MQLPAYTTDGDEIRIQIHQTSFETDITNADRATWAGAALVAFAHQQEHGTPANWSYLISALVADLAHACDSLGLDFQAGLNLARTFYDTEVTPAENRVSRFCW